MLFPVLSKFAGFNASLAMMWLLTQTPSVGAELQSGPENPGIPRAISPKHWSFKPPANVFPPPGAGASPTANPIDAFILAKLRDRSIEPVEPAGRAELLRRVTFDLTGLPPARSELNAFTRDRSPEAFEKVVDRLLSSPRFGERWTQHWLDLAHYADSNGFELDADRPDAWRYRDWVIRVLNEDLPYDLFIALQVAGDEVAPESHEALIAAGFARSGPREVVSGNIDPEVRRQDELTAATTTVGSVFLGLTIGCARCHDHKFDPLPTTDYYSLQAYFAGAQLNEVPLHSSAEKAQHERASALVNARIKPLEEARTKLEGPYRARLLRLKEASLTPRELDVRAKPKDQRTPEEARLFEGTNVALKVSWEEIAEAVAGNPVDHPARESIKRQIHELQLRLPTPLAYAMSMTEGTAPLPETRVLRRGNIKNKLDVVEPAPPGILCLHREGPEDSIARAKSRDSTHLGRRLKLARWLASSDNPLTARVIVNRLWQQHFGRGLVATPSDLGTRGAPPANQELLDWLARELIRNGWRLKPLHRLMVTSKTYQRSSGKAGSPSGAAKDPGNVYLWRMNRRRMEAEGLRDSTLAVAGLLNLRTGGPGIRIPLEPEVKALIFTEAEVVDLWPVEPEISEHWRRSIYVHRKRNVHYPMFDAFDVPDAQTPCPQRPVSTHAPQALVMINGQFAQQSAKAFASSLLKFSKNETARIQEAFLRCYARKPTPEELNLTRTFLLGDSRAELVHWTDFTLALINSNEFIYVP